MAERAALVTGASSGIGLAIARMLAGEGYGVTLVARRPRKLEEAFRRMRDEGREVVQVAADVGSEADVVAALAAHRDAFGRLDVLVNSAGVGIGGAIGELQAGQLDLQLATNLRSLALVYRESVELLAAAAAQRGSAQVVNLASIAGKRGQAWLSVYSATKAGVVGFTEAMNVELGPRAIKSTALCPGFVDTPMTDFVKQHVPPATMIQTSDITAAVRMLLALTPGCVVPEIVFQRPDPSPATGAG